MKPFMIGTVKLDRDTVMTNTSFSYAADWQQINVPAGEYPIYGYKTMNYDGKVHVDWQNYIGYEGTICGGNVGTIGDKAHYCVQSYGYSLAQHFIDGHAYEGYTRIDFTLRPEWGIVISDFVSSFDNKRIFVLGLELKDGAEMTYMEEE